jgi:hypothetical protein
MKRPVWWIFQRTVFRSPFSVSRVPCGSSERLPLLRGVDASKPEFVLYFTGIENGRRVVIATRNDATGEFAGCCCGRVFGVERNANRDYTQALPIYFRREGDRRPSTLPASVRLRSVPHNDILPPRQSDFDVTERSWYAESMSIVIDQTAFDRGADPLFKLLTPEQFQKLLALSPDHGLETRVEQLAEQSREGELGEHEKAEYEGYVRANNLLAVIQGIVRRRLASGNPRS